MRFLLTFWMSILIAGVAHAGDPHSVLADATVSGALDKFSNLNIHDRCKSQAKTCAKMADNLIEYEKQSGFFGLLTSQYQACNKNANEHPEAFSSAREMAKQFEQYQGADLGPQVHGQIQNCFGGSQQGAQERISKYYYHFNQIQKKLNSNFYQMASIDQVLQSRPLSDTSCANQVIGSSQKLCRTLQACPKSDLSVDKLGQETALAKVEIANQEQEKARLNTELTMEVYREEHRIPDPHESKVSSKEASLREKIAEIDFEINLKSSHYPWLDGSAYKAAIKNSKSEAEAIKAQLTQDRQGYAAENKKMENLQSCLLGGDGSCAPEGLEKQLLDFEPPPDSYNPSMGNSVEKARETYIYLRARQCTQVATKDRDETSAILMSATEKAALSLTALPLAAYIGGSMAMGEIAGLSRGMQILTIGQKLSTASAAIPFGQRVVDAANACSQKIMDHGHVSELKMGSKPAPINACDAANVYTSSPAVEKFDSCVTTLIQTGEAAAISVGGRLLVPEIARWAAAGAPVAEDVAKATTAATATTAAEVPGRFRTVPMKSIYVGEDKTWRAVFGRRVQYLTPEERQHLLIKVKDGKVFEENGFPIDTKYSIGIYSTYGNYPKAIYVMDKNGNVYISLEQQKGKFHHSSILGGEPVAAAGEITIKNGVITEIDNRSGHYVPDSSHLKQLMIRLKELGIDTSKIQFRNENSPFSNYNFLKKWWRSVSSAQILVESIS